MRAVLTMIAVAAMLAGCGGPSSGGNAATAAAPTDPVEAKIRALNTNMRRLTFFRASHLRTLVPP